MKIKNFRQGEWGKIRAFFTLITNEGFEIKGMKLVEGSKGFFVSAPQEKKEIGGEMQYFDTVWIPEHIREPLNEMASNEYNNPSDARVEQKQEKQPSLSGDDIPF